MSQPELWPFRYDISSCHHFILINMMTYICIITLQQQKYNGVIDTYNHHIRIRISTRPKIVLGKLRKLLWGISSAYKNETHKWRDNPDTKIHENKNFNRIFQILLCKLHPWLWAPLTKFHSWPLYEGVRAQSHYQQTHISPNIQNHHWYNFTAYGKIN